MISMTQISNSQPLFNQASPSESQLKKGAIKQIEESIAIAREESRKDAEIERQTKENNPPGSREWIA